METRDALIENLRKIMQDRGITQAALAEYAQTSPSQFSKILNGKVQLTIKQLSNIATELQMRIIDIFTYPDIYINSESDEAKQNVRAILSIELSQVKKDQVMRLVFGENDIKILND